MKCKHIFFILLIALVLIIPRSVRAEKTCVYKGKSGATGIEIVNGNDSSNYTTITVNTNDYLEKASVLGKSDITVSYEHFKNGCPEHIYICMYAQFAVSYNIYLSSDTTHSCITYTNLGLVNYSGYGSGGQGGSGGRGGSGGSGSSENISCEYLFGDPDDSKYAAYWMQWTMNLIKYLGIIALFVMSTVDFVKALVQSDQDALKKAATTSIKRFIFCVLLFFLPIIVDTLMSFLGAYGTCNIG